MGGSDRSFYFSNVPGGTGGRRRGEQAREAVDAAWYLLCAKLKETQGGTKLTEVLGAGWVMAQWGRLPGGGVLYPTSKRMENAQPCSASWKPAFPTLQA